MESQSESKLRLEDFNMYKFVLGFAGMVAIIASLFIEDIWMFTIANFIGWGLITYAIGLRRDSQNLFDFNMDRLVKIGISYVLLIIGSICMKQYSRLEHRKIHIKNISFFYLITGIILVVLSKAILMIVDLDLVNMSQYMTIFSLSILIVGKVLNTISTDAYQFRLSLVYYIIGFAISLFNLSYNPMEKTNASLTY